MVTDDEIHEAGIAGAYDFVRRTVLPKAQQTLKSLGAQGGLITLQLGPRQWQSRSWDDGELVTSSQTGFEYYLGVLGEFGISRETMSRLRSIDSTPEISASGVTITTKLSVINHLTNNSLRILFAGHMAAYSGDQRLPEGRGLFVWPSLILSNYTQWRDRFELLKDRHLFDRWGTWIGLAPNSRRPTLPMGRRSRTGKARSVDVIRNINNRRVREKADRVSGLLQEYGTLLREFATQTGKPPGRSNVRAVLESHGITISEKDCRRLSQLLKQEVRL